MPPKKSNASTAKQPAKAKAVAKTTTTTKTSVNKNSSNKKNNDNNNSNDNNDNMFKKMKTEWLSISELIVEKQNELEN